MPAATSESAPSLRGFATQTRDPNFGKSSQRRISMKNSMLIVAFLAVGLTVVPAYAQRAGGVQAQIPFSFAVSGKTFPPGTYTMIAASQLLKIEDVNGRNVAFLLTNKVSGRSVGQNGEIIFRCYDYR